MSSGSESDDEYVPEEPEKVSEEESADEETDLQYKEEQECKGQKRKSTQNKKGKKKIKATDRNETQDDDNVDHVSKGVGNPEEEKKREEDLWAKFLEGTDTKPKSNINKPSANGTCSQTSSVTSSKPIISMNNDKTVNDSKDRERRIFEFAGETIVVENDVIKEKINSTESPALANTAVGPSRGRGGGLSNVLGQLNKKNKLSTLEKSKLDWVTYKKEEGIEDEIHSHNKGKEGYLDRKDFLERADLRQYEIERDLRMKRRSNR